MKKNYLLLLTLSFLISLPFTVLNAQNIAQNPDKVVKPVGFGISKNLRDVTLIAPGLRDMSWKNKVIKNKDGVS